MVEAPGYCPPGPKCLFHAAIYRHSRSPGMPEIGIFAANLKQRGWKTEADCCYVGPGFSDLRGLKNMKRLGFLIGGAALLALSACNNSNQDAVSNAELNQPAADDLNTLANDAAVNAENQSVNLPAADQNAADENVTTPTDAIENNVDAM